MKIGLITALEVEAEDYLTHFELTLIKERFGMKLYQGVYQNYELTLMVCGCGKVNATYAVKWLIDEVYPELIMHSGIAGGIGEDIQPLDLVLATTLTYHDVNSEQMVEIPPYMKEFTCSKEFSQKILTYAQRNTLNIKTGRIISGDSFIADSAKAELLAKTYKAEMVDMESAAITQVCNMEEIPLVVLRCASDKASDEATTDYEENEKTASTKAAECFIEIIEKNVI